MTRHITYAEFRENPAKYMDELAGYPVYIERAAGSVVMLSRQEFESLVETAHLLSSPANASRLLSSIKAAQAGELQEHALQKRKVKLHWSDAAREDYLHWQQHDAQVFKWL
jgi:antitoxin YefM